MSLFNKAVSQTLPVVPKTIVGYFAKRYIAGEAIDDAVRTVKRLTSEGASATIDVLGEEITQKEHAQNAANLYKEVLHRIHAEHLDSGVSLKPTHMGLKLDKSFCYNNIREIVQLADQYGRFVRIDMEDHSTTDDTLDMYIRLKKEFSNVGTVIQAYLRRTLGDVNALLPQKPDLRLCKGIYIEPYSMSYKDHDIVNRNFTYALEKLLSGGARVGIATHDEKLVWEAIRIIDHYQVPRDQYEFQMLLGVTPELRRIIISAGHRMRVYIPFGAEWLQYSTRRLKENPDIVGHVTKSMFQRMFSRNGSV